MGNKTSKPQEGEVSTLSEKCSPEEIAKSLAQAMKDLAGEKIAYKAMDFMNNPQSMLPSIPPQKFKKWKGYMSSFGVGVGVGGGITGSALLHHKLHGTLVALVGKSMPLWAGLIAYAALAANISMIVLQIHSIYKTAQLLNENNKRLGEVNNRIRKLKREVTELLNKCDKKNWEELAKPEGMKKLNGMLDKIVDTQAELNQKIHELQVKSKFMKGLAIGSGSLAALTIIGGACALALIPTGVGGLVLLGCVIASGAVCGIGAGVSAYYAYQCDKQLVDFRKAKAKLDVLAATLKAIRENIKTNSMKPVQVKEWLLNRGLKNFGNYANTLLDSLEKEHYLVLDVIKTFDEEIFLRDMSKYNLKDNVKRVLVLYLTEFRKKIISGEKLLANLSQEISDFDDYKDLLIKWGLEQYTKKFEKEGYDTVRDWKDLDENTLTQDITMKRGHAKKFIRETKQYFKKYSQNN